LYHLLGFKFINAFFTKKKKKQHEKNKNKCGMMDVHLAFLKNKKSLDTQKSDNTRQTSITDSIL
jgi:hypothetical protein